MKASDSFYQDSCYPGCHVPEINSSSLLASPAYTNQHTGISSFVSLEEFEMFYKIDVPVTGARAHELIVQVHDGYLNVMISRVSGARDMRESYLVCDVQLPSDADAEFGYAEYQQGVLSVYFSRAESCGPYADRQIVVY